MPSAPSDNPLPYNPVPIVDSGAGGIPAGVNFIPATQNPAGTTSTGAAVMMGLGVGSPAWVATPVISGRFLVIATGQLANNTASDGAAVNIRWGLGTPPANGAALTGTQIGGAALLTGNAGSAALAVPFCLVGIITGLTPGVAVWFDLALRALTGGTATAFNSTVQVIEF